MTSYERGEPQLPPQHSEGERYALLLEEGLAATNELYSKLQDPVMGMINGVVASLEQIEAMRHSTVLPDDIDTSAQVHEDLIESYEDFRVQLNDLTDNSTTTSVTCALSQIDSLVVGPLTRAIHRNQLDNPDRITALTSATARLKLVEDTVGVLIPTLHDRAKKAVRERELTQGRRHVNNELGLRLNGVRTSLSRVNVDAYRRELGEVKKVLQWDHEVAGELLMLVDQPLTDLDECITVIEGAIATLRGELHVLPAEAYKNY